MRCLLFLDGRWDRILAVTFFATGTILSGTTSREAPDKLSGYAYEDTCQLVALVKDAAKLLEEKGEAAFSSSAAKALNGSMIPRNEPGPLSLVFVMMMVVA